MGTPPRQIELSVIIPAAHEARNLTILLPRLTATIAALGLAAEVIVVDRHEDRATRSVAVANAATLVVQDTPGYGGALRTGFAQAAGEWVATMDADLSHPPSVVANLWTARHTASVLIASRWVKGANAQMPPSRFLLSRTLNLLYGVSLGLPVRDISSGFRLYQRQVLADQRTSAVNFGVLQELLVLAHAAGWSIAEIPFSYAPRQYGRSHARILAFGFEYVASLPRLRAMRAGKSAGPERRATGANESVRPGDTLSPPPSAHCDGS